MWDLVTWPGVKPGPPALGVCRILAIGPPGKSFDSSSAGRYTHPMDRRRSVFIPITKNGNAKDCSNYHTIALISHASKVTLKIIQARLQQYVNWERPDVQAGFRKGRGTRDQIANICWIIEKTRKFQKNIYFCFIDYAKALGSVYHNKLWKIIKEMQIPDHLTCLLRNLYEGQKAKEPEM